MSIITAQEWEVLYFFEVEPERLDPEIAWPYNDFVYLVSQGDLSLSCAIAPAYKDVRLILARNDVRLYELNAVGVKDVHIKTDNGQERMEIELNERETLVLKLRPQIEITHHVSNEL